MIDSATFYFEGPLVTARGLPCSHRNLRIILKTSGAIVQGSLPKYFFGENASRMSRASLQACLFQLKKELELDFDKAQVWNIEIGDTYQTKRPGHEYISSFQSMPLMQRTTFGDGSTVLFSNNTRSFQAYDKAIEMMEKIKTIIPQYRGETLLRLELKLKKNLSRIFGRPIFGADLYDEVFYKSLLDLYQEAYFSIHKRSTFKMPDIKNLTPKSLESALAAYAIENIGLEELLAIIEANRFNFDRKTIQRFKATVIEHTRIPGINYFDEMIQELDQQVIASCMYYR